MNAKQRWCLWVGLLSAIVLYLVPPWRYDIAGEVRSSGSIALGRRDAHAYSVHNRPPDYSRSWQRGHQLVVERAENVHVDVLRLTLSWFFLGGVVFATMRLFRAPRAPALSSLTSMILGGVLAWAIVDSLVITLRPRAETYLLYRSFARQYQHHQDSLRAAAAQPR